MGTFTPDEKKELREAFELVQMGLIRTDPVGQGFLKGANIRADILAGKKIEGKRLGFDTRVLSKREHLKDLIRLRELLYSIMED